jgi:hypothetical protein
MAGTPFKNRVLAALRARAAARAADEAEPDVLAYCCDWIRDGGTILKLAESLAADSGGPVSRSFLSGVLHNLAPDATERIKAARNESATAYIDEAVQIADDAEPTSAGVQKAKLQVATRTFMAGKLDPATWGERSPVVNINMGSLMLDALRTPVAQLGIQPAPTAIAATTEAEFEVVAG